MARDGALTLSDVAGERLTIVCPPCARRGSYRIRRLFTERGDAKLTDIMHDAAADCPRRQELGVNRCQAHFEGLITRR